MTTKVASERMKIEFLGCKRQCCRKDRIRFFGQRILISKLNNWSSIWLSFDTFWFVIFLAWLNFWIDIVWKGFSERDFSKSLIPIFRKGAYFDQNRSLGRIFRVLSRHGIYLHQIRTLIFLLRILFQQYHEFLSLFYHK